MYKKLLIAAVLSLGMMSAGASVTAQDAPVEAPAQEQTLPDGQVVMEPQTPPSEEVNTVEESAIAHKMTQAEKSENARVNDSWGGAITIIAMTIVLSALIILSVLFYIFGKISEKMLSNKKKKAKGNSPTASHCDDHDVDSGEAIAAIAMALAEHFEQAHDVEDTILTIRRMKKSYSPWNSKIYNLRELPEAHHNPVSHSAFNKH